MASHEDTGVELAPVEVRVDDSVKVPAVEETSKDSGRLQYTREQLLNMKLEPENTESTTTANGIKDTLLEIGVSAPKVENPKPSVTFAPETKNAEEDSAMDETSIPDGSATALTNSKEKSAEEKPKKKKKRSSGKNKQPAPTGFEEFYADPPMTPSEQMEEEMQLYNENVPFAERIETCIQRYRARRKLDSARSNVFTKYLIFGGIESGMKPFSGGLDSGLLENGDKEDIALHTATDYVGGSNNIKFYNPAKPQDWVVDFEGVVKGFLSSKAPHALDLVTKEKIANCCGVIRNFLNYVLLHAVCPEYTQEVLNSKILCDKAEAELCAIQRLGRLLPDSFNIACSTLYGGFFQGMYAGKDSPWGPTEEDLATYGPHFLGMSQDEAERIVKTAIALMGNEEMSKSAAAGTIHVVKEEARSFEVIEIIRVDSKVKDAYAVAKDINDKPGGMKPLGILKVKHFDNPDCDAEDCSEDGTEPDVTYEVEEFWVADDILEHCFIGLKMKALVHELNVGLKYFDTIHGLYCSFFTVLPNEKMDDYKEPTLSTRPGPTVDNPRGHGEDGDDEGGDNVQETEDVL